MAINCGAKIVHGHHPHILQGVEFYKQGLIAYSLGNFIFDQKSQVCKESALLYVQVSLESLKSVSIIPLEILNNRPQLAGKKKGKEINVRRTRLCQELGTETATSKEGFLQLQLKAKTAAKRP